METTLQCGSISLPPNCGINCAEGKAWNKNTIWSFALKRRMILSIIYVQKLMKSNVSCLALSITCLWVSVLLSMSVSSLTYECQFSCLWVSVHLSMSVSSLVYECQFSCLWVSVHLSMSVSSLVYECQFTYIWVSVLLSMSVSSPVYECQITCLSLCLDIPYYLLL